MTIMRTRLSAPGGAVHILYDSSSQPLADDWIHR